MSQETLHTARLTLAPLSDADIEDEIALDADAAVMRYLIAGRPRTRDEVVRAHAQRMHEAVAADGFGFWTGRIDGEFVGWWILGAVSEERRVVTAELGYRLLPRWWRQGLASEGGRELLRHGFEDLAVTTVIAQTMAVNEGSRATMTSLGLRLVRTFHLAPEEVEAPIAGIEHGEVEYAVTRDNWLTRSASDPPPPLE